MTHLATPSRSTHINRQTQTMTAMQIYYALMKLDEVNDVVFVNGELPAYMRAFIDDKLKSESGD